MIIRNFSAALLALCFSGSTVVGDNEASAKDAESRNEVSALEGILKIHPKYLFKYYITGFGNGQACALFGKEKLEPIEAGSRIHVEGRLGTRFHEGGSEQNLSPFPRTSYIFMEVETVRVLHPPEDRPDGPTKGSPPVPAEKPLPGPDVAKDGVKGDPEKIQGRWTVISAEDSGHKTPDELIQNLKWVITKDTITYKFGDTITEWTYKLDQTKKPKAIDLTEGDRTALGIYSLEGDTLMICFPEGAKDERSTAFESKANSVNDVLIVLKREKP
ncbi:MAG TPA: TIGR03067 domain-containing protein [Verrucomicrobiales bacterium]|nr:TIGR03067 domain-containing protein [Verrucomicrobiales bacterium]